VPGRTPRSSHRIWLLAVVGLSLPSIVFVVSHGLYGALHLSAQRPLGVLEPVLSWTMAFMGMIGAVLTFTAVVVTVVASFLRSVTLTSKAVMWLIAGASVLACVYGSQIRP
jgi:hypothetical protein